MLAEPVEIAIVNELGNACEKDLLTDLRSLIRAFSKFVHGSSQDAAQQVTSVCLFRIR